MSTRITRSSHLVACKNIQVNGENSTLSLNCSSPFKKSNMTTTTMTTPLVKKRKSMSTTPLVTSLNQKGLKKTPKSKYALTSNAATPKAGHAMRTETELAASEQVAFATHQVSVAYKIIRKATGALGGNAAGGAIYGEITQKSFQRIMDYLKTECALSSASKFIDVGSGLGKPNIHAAIDPACSLSFGLELEPLRWQLSLHNLKELLKSEKTSDRPSLASHVVFVAGDIFTATTFNPFTHIYSFDTGFPPDAMTHMAKCFNASATATYLCSYHNPKKVMTLYGYDVEELTKISTSMAGSSEGHTCYIYKRCVKDEKIENTSVDDVFQTGIDVLSGGKAGLLTWINTMNGDGDEEAAKKNSRRTRQSGAKRQRTSLTQTTMPAYCRVVPKLSAERPPKSL